VFHRDRIDHVPKSAAPARGLFDRDETLWLGYVLQAPGGPIYFAGDTGLGPHFDLIRERFGPMRLAMLPIGAYLPRWFMKPVHMSPGDAIAAHKMLKAQTSLGIHYGTFRLALDGQFQGRDELHSLAKASELGNDEFITPEFGQGQMIKPLATATAVPVSSH
jgi:L-ascorbate metabolism protein UlaG (beta-lactamase superfamily)